MNSATSLMGECCWSFTGTRFSERSAFEAEFASYQKDIRGITAWDGRVLAFDGPQIQVQYECWEGDEEISPVVTLTAPDGKSFSGSELMFQLHNAVVEQLNRIDHHFFEGLSLISDGEGSPPLYSLDCGS